MAKRKLQKNDIRVFVEVLQNGELLSKTSRPFYKPGVIYLSSNPDSELTAPFYPLPTDIQLVKITKRGAELDLDPNWEGFTTYNGKIEEISSNQRTNYTHILKNGDYGSIAYNDLRILIRIGKKRPKKKAAVRPSKEYSGKAFDLWIGSSIEKKMILVATLASMWIFGGLVYGLLNRPDDRPRQPMDLRPEYTLPFIHPLHLKNLPEALQENYQQNNIVGSAYHFFKSFAATLMNYPRERNPSIFRNTINLYQNLYQENDAKISTIIEQQQAFEDELLQKQATAIVRVPAVYGETLEGSLLRLKDKIDILHQSLEASLQSRIETTAAFFKESEYDYELYRRIPLQSTKAKPKATGMEWLRPREQAIYREAQRMANYAAFNQERIKRHREPVTLLDPENSAPIALPENNSLLSYLPFDNWQDLNQKIELLKASEFDVRRPQKVREPLLGEIEPHLIRQTIEKHRFELQLCFELALRRNQNLTGKMEWQWRLDSRGRISDLELIYSSIEDRRMIRCVQQKIARWPFPRPRRGSVQIQYPFHFAPAKG